MLKRVPREYDRTISASAGNTSRANSKSSVASRYCLTASTNQSAASTVLNSGASPLSGKVFGNIPPSIKLANDFKSFRAKSVRPVTNASPQTEIAVSRLQTPNHGYPAIMLDSPNVLLVPAALTDGDSTRNWS